MKSKIEEAAVFSQCNKFSRVGGVVIFGSTFAADLPITELAMDADMDVMLYNRSIHGLQADEAEMYLDSCVKELCPKKLFLNIGDADLGYAGFSTAGFISTYEAFVKSAKKKLPNTDIYIVSVCSIDQKTESVNEELRKLTERMLCEYIDITRSAFGKDNAIRVFRDLRACFRLRNITFADAMVH